MNRLAFEDDLLNRLRRGEHDAFAELVRRFEDRLYRYFLASHGDPQLAGEQSADCFGNLVESLPKMTGGPDQLLPFVYAVARNVLRRQWRRPSRDFASLIDAAAIADGRPAPDAEYESRDESARALEAIRTLDPATREVFLLRFVEQMSVAEVAIAVGEPIGTVKSRLHRGRLRLQEILQSTKERR
jgi:RNA polymerase sigma-70 factor, ECF subfamily